MTNRVSRVAAFLVTIGMLYTGVGVAATVTVNCFGALPESLVDAFNKQNPGVKLVVKTPQMLSDKAYQSAVRSGDYDLMVNLASPGYMDQWVQSGLFQPLDDYIRRDGINLGIFAGNLADAMRLDGRIYDLPLRLDPYYVIYNRDTFDSRGVDYPRAGWTWDDFRAMATHLKGSAPDSYGAVVPTHIWALLAEQQANLIYEVPLEKYASIIAFTKNMVNDKSLSIDLPQEINGGSVMVTNQGFVKGDIAMQVTRGSIRAQDFNVGIAPLPAPTGLMATTPVSVLSIGIPKAARHAAEAWRVIRFLTTTQASQLLAANGWLPAANLTPAALGLWATAKVGSVPTGAESLAGITPSVADRRLAQINSDFRYLLEKQASEFFRGRRSEESVLQLVRTEQQSVKAKALETLSGK